MKTSQPKNWILNLIDRFACIMGYHHEADLFLYEIPALFEYINSERGKGWGAWYKIPYDKFGLAYYLQCKKCGKIL